MQGKIFAIIVTYNGARWIQHCLDSIVADIPESSIIIIDNNSTDQTCEIIKQNYPEVRLYPQHKNLGFGKANNLGLQYALEQRATHVLLLNQDAWLAGSSLSKMMTCLRQNPEIALLSPMQIQPSSHQLDHLFSTYLENKSSESENLAIVPFVNAAIWLLPRSTVEIIGGFDPLFPHYGEDADYANRCKYHGLKMAIQLDAEGYHDRDSSIAPPLYRRKYFEYIQTLVRLKDINANFYLCLIQSLGRILRYFLAALSKGEFDLAGKDVSNGWKILSMSIKIVGHRRKSAQTGTTFLNPHEINP